jgi:hypothetical protein
MIFLLPLTGEAVNQYPPGGNVLSSILHFTSGVVIALGMVSSWRPHSAGRMAGFSALGAVGRICAREHWHGN